METRTTILFFSKSPRFEKSVRSILEAVCYYDSPFFIVFRREDSHLKEREGRSPESRWKLITFGQGMATCHLDCPTVREHIE